MSGCRNRIIKVEVKNPKLGTLSMSFHVDEANQAATFLRDLFGPEGKPKEKAWIEEAREVRRKITFLDMPTVEEIAEYIEGKGGKMIHACYELQEFFFNRKFRYPEDETARKRLSKLHTEARKLLERKYDGQFIGERRTQAEGVTRPYVFYEFSKDIGPPKLASQADVKDDQVADPVKEQVSKQAYEPKQGSQYSSTVV